MGRLVAPKREGPALAAASGEDDGYLDRVAKYVPTEIVAGYVALNGAATGLPDSWRPWALAGTFALCLILTPFYLKKMAKPGQPKRLHIRIAIIAFVFWAYAVGGAPGFFGPEGLNWYNAALAAMLLAAFSLISGAFAPKPGDP